MNIVEPMDDHSKLSLLQWADEEPVPQLRRIQNPSERWVVGLALLEIVMTTTRFKR